MKFTVTAGHGGRDPGAVAADGTTEAAIVTELRDIVAGKLRGLGHAVRTDGGLLTNLPLVHALTLVPGADLAIELHCNASESRAARGVEVVSLHAQVEQARTIARKIAHVLETPVRGAGGWIDQRQSARGRLGFVRLGGLVVECFFLSNPEELAKYEARKWRVATSIVEAITGGGAA
ncbi:N-acetylmuramoyl-L-alanine amidase [Hydrogenophaga taeniospiralis]|uniref:N-acetylmuramoyl-L-alanine amidase n=1 Tax=Hydrogenophaga taeniospiralis TaxID=65656 RepID=UPI001CFA3FCE|nr:N-acetylmuramoyl-L-alanine amidase [Hydrogenophaga taeniospiralis]MCB4365395.1 N-acetylmuramoyl-L-alanine amidase [Hydrogenophaga taeniospiralis]